MRKGQDFRDLLHEWRKREKIGQAAAAARLGVPRRTYEGWERRRNPYVPRPLIRELVMGKIGTVKDSVTVGNSNGRRGKKLRK
jgi:DNA-binding XRE family transcriptional regulator